MDEGKGNGGAGPAGGPAGGQAGGPAGGQAGEQARGQAGGAMGAGGMGGTGGAGGTGPAGGARGAADARNKAVITVIGVDRVGIIASVSRVLADAGVNIEDISQTILQGHFMMFMLVDVSGATVDFGRLAALLAGVGAELGMEIRIQRDEVFRAMHTV
jgi:ACT domain-containing protein